MKTTVIYFIVYNLSFIATYVRANISIDDNFPTLFELCNSSPSDFNLSTFEKKIFDKYLDDIGESNEKLKLFKNENHIQSEMDFIEKANLSEEQKDKKIFEFRQIYNDFRAEYLNKNYQVENKFKESKKLINNFLANYISENSTCVAPFNKIIQSTIFPLQGPMVDRVALRMEQFNMEATYLYSIDNQYIYFRNENQTLGNIKYAPHQFEITTITPAILGQGYHVIEDILPGEYIRAMLHEWGHLLTNPYLISQNLFKLEELDRDFQSVKQNLVTQMAKYQEVNCNNKIADVFTCLSKTTLCNYKDEKLLCAAEIFGDIVSSIITKAPNEHFHRIYCQIASENEYFNFKDTYYNNVKSWKSYPTYRFLSQQQHPAAIARYESIVKPFIFKKINSEFKDDLKSIHVCIAPLFNEKFKQDFELEF